MATNTYRFRQVDKEDESRRTADYNEETGNVSPARHRYVDDLTQFMAWQNWYLFQYNSFLMASQFLRAVQIAPLPRQTQTHTTEGLQSTVNNNNAIFSSIQSDGNQEVPRAHGRGDNSRPRRVIEASLAPLHKRIAAELVDSIVLLIVKLIFITLVFGDKYVEKFQYILIIDDKTSIQDLEAMLYQALFFKAGVILYETICLSGTIIPQTQGMTFGKRLLRLKVVQCEKVEPTGHANNRFRIIPGHVLGFWNSLMRAFLKSFFTSLLFPMCIPLNLFAFHHRLVYDIISGSVVVQDALVIS